MKYIITGSSSGLGFHLSEKLILKGHVLGISRSLGKAENLISSGYFHFYKHDFSLENTNNNNLLNLKNDLIRYIDNEPFTLILNAASFYSGSKRLTDKMLKNMFNVNVFSMINLIESLNVANLKRIFIINSISGIIGQRDQHEYSSSKHAIMGYSHSLAKSAKYLNYDVMTINPGGMKTELWSNYNEVDTSDFLSPAVIADICVALILIPQRTFIENMTILPPSDIST